MWFKKRLEKIDYKKLYEDLKKSTENESSYRQIDIDSLKSTISSIHNQLGVKDVHTYTSLYLVSGGDFHQIGRYLAVIREYIRNKKLVEFDPTEVMYRVSPERISKSKLYICQLCQSLERDHDLRFHALKVHNTTTYYTIKEHVADPKDLERK